MEGVDAEAGCSNYVLMHVVDEHGFLGQGVDFAQRVVIDRGSGLTRSYAARIDARGEEAHERISGLEVRYVDGIGIGQQGKVAFFSETFEQEVRQDWFGIEDTIPNCAEFFKVMGKMEFFREVRVPIARSYPAFLPIRPVRVRLEFSQDLHMGQSVALSERSHATGQIDANDDAANIKDHGARGFFNGGT